MPDSRICVYIGDELGRYGFGREHPFGTDRMAAFWNQAVAQGLDNKVCIHQPVMAGQNIIERFHTHAYVERVKALSDIGEGYLDFGDTPVVQGIYTAAAYVTGSSVDAMEQIMQARCSRAFVPIAGLHHARRDTAAGFCVFNDCGVVIESLRHQHSIARVCYVDIDAHHGDGVFYSFEQDSDVYIIDVHEDGRYLYPGTGNTGETGSGSAAGTKLNIPMPPAAGDDAFFDVWPRIETFIRDATPDFILLQCGADSIGGDPITHMQFSPAVHYHTTLQLCRIADDIGHGRVLALGGGGYNRSNIAAAWCAVVQAFIDSQ
jgi:acetoin utilization protein AcuC